MQIVRAVIQILGPSNRRPALSLKILLVPWQLAGWLFIPRSIYQHEDVLISRLGLARSYAGILLTAGAAWLYNRPALGEYPAQLVTSGTNMIVVGGIVIIAISSIAIAAVVHPGHRRQAATSLARPVLVVLMTWAILFVLLHLPYVGIRIASSATEARSIENEYYRESASYSLGEHLLLWIPQMWIFLFLLTSVYYLVRHVARSAEGHPSLPAVVTVCTTWIVWITDILDRIGVHLPMLNYSIKPTPELSWAIFLVVSASGVIATTVLAIIELHRIRPHFQFRIGPWI